MKPILTIRSLAGLVMLTGLLLAQPAFATGKPYSKPMTVSNEPEEEVPAKKEKNKAKNFASLNNSSVKPKKMTEQKLISLFLIFRAPSFSITK